VLWLLMIGLVLLLLGVVAVQDLVQRKHAIRRNFPVIGRFRYYLEKIGPELRQYPRAARRRRPRPARSRAAGRDGEQPDTDRAGRLAEPEQPEVPGSPQHRQHPGNASDQRSNGTGDFAPTSAGRTPGGP